MPEETNLQKNYTNISIKNVGKSEVEIEGEITAEKLDTSRVKAAQRLSETLDIPGFRKGKAPEAVIAKHLGGEYPILEDAAEIALQDEYPKILDEHKVDAVGRPHISITKLARNNPLGFKIRTAIMPTIGMPDYARIAKSKNAKTVLIEISDKEVDDALQTIRKNKAHHDLHEKAGLKQNNHAHGEIKDEDLPALDDEFARSVGAFQTLDELKSKVKESLEKEKEYKMRDAKRIEIMDEIVEKMKVDLPDVMIESELGKMVAQFKDDIARAGLTFEDYLKEVKKSEEDIRKEWRESAKKKTKYQLALNEIARAEKLEADPSMLENEAKQLSEVYADADPLRIRIYVETMLVNEKVLKFLEEAK